MIFVAVGTQKFQFNRLLRIIDNLVLEHFIDEEVIAQSGYSSYSANNYVAHSFLSQDEFENTVSQCSILITHGGVGTIMSGLQRNKPVIIFPRLKKYGEHVDDHQLEIAEVFNESSFAISCTNEDALKKALGIARAATFKKYESHKEDIVNTILEYIEANIRKETL